MSEAAAGNKRLIKEIDEVIGPFLAGNKNGKAGIELELTFFKRGRYGRLDPITNEENKALQDALNHPEKHGYTFAPVDTSEEAATMTLEIKTGAASFDDLETILRDLDRQLEAVKQVCRDKDYVVCPYAQAPHITAEQLHDLVIARDSKRAEAFINTFRAHGLDSYYRNFFLNNAIQVSVSYKDPAHLYRNIKRLAFLTAPLSNAHDNSSGFLEGREDPQQTGLRLREGLGIGGRGGCPDFFFTSSDGADFIRNYFNWAFSTPLLARCDENGENMIAVAPGDQKSFRQLIAEDQGLNNQTNFELALGMLWPHLKLAYIRDEDANIKGVRYEARACDSGDWRNASFPLLVAALAFDEDFATHTDALLAEYGFDVDDAHGSLGLYRDSVDAALNYEDRFGTGTATEFLARFGKLAQNAFTARPTAQKRLTPFFNVCASGAFPGLAQRSENPHLSDVLREKDAENPQKPLERRFELG